MLLMSLLKPGKRVSYFLLSSCTSGPANISFIPTGKVSFSSVTVQAPFIKVPSSSFCLISHRQGFSGCVRARSCLFLLSPELVSSHSSSHTEPCASMISQSHSMLSAHSESPWRPQLGSPSSCCGSLLVLSAELPGVSSDS